MNIEEARKIVSKYEKTWDGPTPEQFGAYKFIEGWNAAVKKSGEEVNGWTCPGCFRCYSPYKLQCDYCGPQELKFTQDKKCLACNGYHSEGLACPVWIVGAKSV